MKVKDLIGHLNSYNMDADIEVRTELGKRGKLVYTPGEQPHGQGSESIVQITICEDEE